MILKILKSNSSLEQKIADLKSYTATLDFIDELKNTHLFIKETIQFSKKVLSKYTPVTSLGPANDTRVFIIRLLLRLRYDKCKGTAILCELQEMVCEIIHQENIFNRYLALRILSSIIDTQIDQSKYLGLIETFFTRELGLTLYTDDLTKCELGFFVLSEVLQYMYEYEKQYRLDKSYAPILRLLCKAIGAYYSTQGALERFKKHTKILAEYCGFSIKLLQLLNILNLQVGGSESIIPYIPEICYSLTTHVPEECYEIRKQAISMVFRTIIVRKELFTNIDRCFRSTEFNTTENVDLQIHILDETMRFVTSIGKTYMYSFTMAMCEDFDLKIREFYALSKGRDEPALMSKCAEAFKFNLHLGRTLQLDASEAKKLMMRSIRNAHSLMYRNRHISSIEYCKTVVLSIGMFSVKGRLLDVPEHKMLADMLVYPLAAMKSTNLRDYCESFKKIPPEDLDVVMRYASKTLLIRLHHRSSEWEVLQESIVASFILIECAIRLLQDYFNEDDTARRFRGLNTHQLDVIFPMAYEFLKLDKKHIKNDLNDQFRYIYESMLRSEDENCFRLLNRMYLDIKASETAYAGLYFVYNTFDIAVDELSSQYNATSNMLYIECLLNIPVSLNLLITRHAQLLKTMKIGLEGSKRMREIALKYIEYIVEFDNTDGTMDEILILIYQMLKDNELSDESKGNVLNVLARISTKHRGGLSTMYIESLKKERMGRCGLSPRKQMLYEIEGRTIHLDLNILLWDTVGKMNRDIGEKGRGIENHIFLYYQFLMKKNEFFLVPCGCHGSNECRENSGCHSSNECHSNSEYHSGSKSTRNSCCMADLQLAKKILLLSMNVINTQGYSQESALNELPAHKILKWTFSLYKNRILPLDHPLLCEVVNEVFIVAENIAKICISKFLDLFDCSNSNSESNNDSAGSINNNSAEGNNHCNRKTINNKKTKFLAERINEFIEIIYLKDAMRASRSLKGILFCLQFLKADDLDSSMALMIIAAIKYFFSTYSNRRIYSVCKGILTILLQIPRYRAYFERTFFSAPGIHLRLLYLELEISLSLNPGIFLDSLDIDALRIFLSVPHLYFVNTNIVQLTDTFLKALDKKNILAIKSFCAFLRHMEPSRNVYDQLSILLKKYLPAVAIVEGFVTQEEKRKFIESVNRNWTHNIKSGALDVMKSLYFGRGLPAPVRISLIEGYCSPYKRMIYEIILYNSEYDVLELDFLLTRMAENVQDDFTNDRIDVIKSYATDRSYMTGRNYTGSQNYTGNQNYGNNQNYAGNCRIPPTANNQLAASNPSGLMTSNDVISIISERIKKSGVNKLGLIGYVMENIHMQYAYEIALRVYDDKVNKCCIKIMGDYYASNLSHQIPHDVNMVIKAYNALRILNKHDEMVPDMNILLLIYKDLQYNEDMVRMVNDYIPMMGEEDLYILYKLSRGFRITNILILRKIKELNNVILKEWILKSFETLVIRRSVEGVVHVSEDLSCEENNGEESDREERESDKEERESERESDRESDCRKESDRRKESECKEESDCRKEWNECNGEEWNDAQYDDLLSVSSDKSEILSFFLNREESEWEETENEVSEESLFISGGLGGEMDGKETDGSERDGKETDGSERDGKETDGNIESRHHRESEDMNSPLRSTSNDPFPLSPQKQQFPISPHPSSDKKQQSPHLMDRRSLIKKVISEGLFLEELNPVSVLKVALKLKIQSDSLVSLAKSNLENLNSRAISIFYLCKFDPSLDLFQMIFKLSFHEMADSLECISILIDRFGVEPFLLTIKNVFQSEMRHLMVKKVLLPLIYNKRWLISYPEIYFEVCVLLSRMFSRGEYNKELFCLLEEKAGNREEGATGEEGVNREEKESEKESVNKEESVKETKDKDDNRENNHVLTLLDELRNIVIQNSITPIFNSIPGINNSSMNFINNNLTGNFINSNPSMNFINESMGMETNSKNLSMETNKHHSIPIETNKFINNSIPMETNFILKLSKKIKKEFVHEILNNNNFDVLLFLINKQLLIKIDINFIKNNPKVIIKEEWVEMILNVRDRGSGNRDSNRGNDRDSNKGNDSGNRDSNSNGKDYLIDKEYLVETCNENRMILLEHLVYGNNEQSENRKERETGNGGERENWKESERGNNETERESAKRETERETGGESNQSGNNQTKFTDLCFFLLKLLAETNYENTSRFSAVFSSFSLSFPFLTATWLLEYVPSHSLVYLPLFSSIPQLIYLLDSSIAISLALLRPPNLPDTFFYIHLLHLYKNFNNLPFSNEFISGLSSPYYHIRTSFINLILSRVPKNLYSIFEFILLTDFKNSRFIELVFGYLLIGTLRPLQSYSVRDVSLLKHFHGVTVNVNGKESVNMKESVTVNVNGKESVTVNVNGKESVTGRESDDKESKKERDGERESDKSVTGRESVNVTEGNSDNNTHTRNSPDNNNTHTDNSPLPFDSNDENLFLLDLFYHSSSQAQFLRNILQSIFPLLDPLFIHSIKIMLINSPNYSQLRKIFNFNLESTSFYFSLMDWPMFYGKMKVIPGIREIKLISELCMEGENEKTLEKIFEVFKGVENKKISYKKQDMKILVDLLIMIYQENNCCSNGATVGIGSWLNNGIDNPSLSGLFSCEGNMGENIMGDGESKNMMRGNRESDYNFSNSYYTSFDQNYTFTNNSSTFTNSNSHSTFPNSNSCSTFTNNSHSTFTNNSYSTLSVDHYSKNSYFPCIFSYLKILVDKIVRENIIPLNEKILSEVKDLQNQLFSFLNIPFNSPAHSSFIFFMGLCAEILESSSIIKDDQGDSLYGRFKLWMSRYPEITSGFCEWAIFMRWRVFIFNTALNLVTEVDKKKISSELCKLYCMFANKAFKERKFQKAMYILNEINGIMTIEAKQNLQKYLLDIECLFNLKNFNGVINLVNSINIGRIVPEGRSLLYFWGYKAYREMGKEVEAMNYENMSKKMGDIIENRKEDVRRLRERVKERVCGREGERNDVSRDENWNREGVSERDENWNREGMRNDLNREINDVNLGRESVPERESLSPRDSLSSRKSLSPREFLPARESPSNQQIPVPSIQPNQQIPSIPVPSIQSLPILPSIHQSPLISPSLPIQSPSNFPVQPNQQTKIYSIKLIELINQLSLENSRIYVMEFLAHGDFENLHLVRPEYLYSFVPYLKDPIDFLNKNPVVKSSFLSIEILVDLYRQVNGMEMESKENMRRESVNVNRKESAEKRESRENMRSVKRVNCRESVNWKERESDCRKERENVNWKEGAKATKSHQNATNKTKSHTKSLVFPVFPETESIFPGEFMEIKNEISTSSQNFISSTSLPSSITSLNQAASHVTTISYIKKLKGTIFTLRCTNGQLRKFNVLPFLSDGNSDCSDCNGNLCNADCNGSHADCNGNLCNDHSPSNRNDHSPSNSNSHSLSKFISLSKFPIANSISCLYHSLSSDYDLLKLKFTFRPLSSGKFKSLRKILEHFIFHSRCFGCDDERESGKGNVRGSEREKSVCENEREKSVCEKKESVRESEREKRECENVRDGKSDEKGNGKRESVVNDKRENEREKRNDRKRNKNNATEINKPEINKPEINKTSYPPSYPHQYNHLPKSQNLLRPSQYNLLRPDFIKGKKLVDVALSHRNLLHDYFKEKISDFSDFYSFRKTFISSFSSLFCFQILLGISNVPLDNFYIDESTGECSLDFLNLTCNENPSFYIRPNIEYLLGPEGINGPFSMIINKFMKSVLENSETQKILEFYFGRKFADLSLGRMKQKEKIFCDLFDPRTGDLMDPELMMWV